MHISIRRPSPGAVIAIAALFVALGGSAVALSRHTESGGGQTLSWTSLTLTHGWTTYPGARHPAVALDPFGIVHLRDGMEFGTGEPFKMPKRFRPAKDVFEPVQLANNATGELAIFNTGEVISPVNSDSSLFTGLDGVSFSK